MKPKIIIITISLLFLFSTSQAQRVESFGFRVMPKVSGLALDSSLRPSLMIEAFGRIPLYKDVIKLETGIALNYIFHTRNYEENTGLPPRKTKHKTLHLQSPIRVIFGKDIFYGGIGLVGDVLLADDIGLDIKRFNFAFQAKLGGMIPINLKYKLKLDIMFQSFISPVELRGWMVPEYYESRLIDLGIGIGFIKQTNP